MLNYSVAELRFNTLYTQYPLNLHFDCRFRGFTKKGLYLPRILKATILGTILKFVIA